MAADLDCFTCGLCCYTGFPPFTPQEIVTLPIEIGQSVIALRGLGWNKDKLPARCGWIQPDGRCKHYDHRPSPCRNFEKGGPDCLAMREAVMLSE